MPLSMIVFAPCVPAAGIDHPETGSVNHPDCAIFWTDCSRSKGGLTAALRAALSFDIRYLIWEVVPCRLAAGSAALERRPAVPESVRLYHPYKVADRRSCPHRPRRNRSRERSYRRSTFVVSIPQPHPKNSPHERRGARRGEAREVLSDPPSPPLRIREAGDSLNRTRFRRGIPQDRRHKSEVGLGRVLIDAQYAAVTLRRPIFTLPLRCPKNDALSVIDDGTL
jgi:hypothetical protein